MKKLFVAVLALAALAACQKDAVDTVVTSKEKSVLVSIQNSVISGTRSEVDGSTLKPGAQGGEAGLTDQVGTTGLDGETETLVADLETLKILFVNSSNVVVKSMNLVNDADDQIHTENGTNAGEYVPGAITGDAPSQTYAFHRVPETVTGVAVIRNFTTNPITITDGKTTLADLKAAAEDEARAGQLGVQDIFLYGYQSLGQSDKCYTADVNGVETTYYYYTATVDIKPQFARFELTQVSCNDLGKYNVDYVKDENGDDTTELNLLTYGFDELTLGVFTMPLNGKEYTKTFNASFEGTPATGTKFYGQYCDKYEENVSTLLAAGEGMAWSWNVAEGTLALDTLPMTLTLNAYAHDYIVNNPAKVVRVVKLNNEAAFKLEKGKVYRLALDFSEDNIDETDDMLCVQATVAIADWKVVLVKPTYGNE